MGKRRKHEQVAELGGPPRSASDVGENARTGPVQSSSPKLAKRRANRKSTIVSGRTIGEKRERLETKNERAAARKKDKKKAARRVVFTIFGFVILGVAVIMVVQNLIFKNEPAPVAQTTEPATEYHPTIEVIDEDASAADGKISSRMETFIGRLERDFKDLGYTPVRAVIPTGSIREVDFYLKDHPGFIKTTTDRDSAVTAEDADRLIRYLAGQGIADYQYLDVRLAGRAFWK